MSAKSHQFLLDVAVRWPKLHRVLKVVGPIHRQARRDLPLPESLCRAVAGQQLSVAAADTIWSRFEAFRGRRDLVPFLARVTDLDLRGCGLFFAKIRSIRAIGEAAERGQLESGRLMRMGHGERTACLTEIPGVGPWTADMIGIFYCGDTDIWPDGDLVARRTLQNLVGKRSKTVRVASTFSPWRSRLAMAMWRAVDAGVL